MTSHWCVNFDARGENRRNHDPQAILRYGIENNLFLMQYQYSHDGKTFEGDEKRKGTFRSNWMEIGRIKVGDRCIAWMQGPMFYGIGEVIEPIKPQTHQDTIRRTLGDGRRQHRFLDGIVGYTDAGAFYEDFTDSFRNSGVNPYSTRSDKSEDWIYPQRIKVKSWEHTRRNTNGEYLCVRTKGLSEAAKTRLVGAAVVEIEEWFFDSVVADLRNSLERE